MNCWRIGLFLVVAISAAGCDQRMIDQEKDKPYGRSELFDDGSVNRAPPAGTVARGDLDWAAALEVRPPMTMALLERGRERYAIYCVPCHGASGNGRGIVVAHGMPAPPSFHTERFRGVPARHFVRVITEGRGAMYSYAARLPPRDRWAVAAYIRALQLAQEPQEVAAPSPEREPQP